MFIGLIYRIEKGARALKVTIAKGKPPKLSKREFATDTARPRYDINKAVRSKYPSL